MFNKLKNLKNLRDQAKQLQSTLADEKIEVERDGIKLMMDGNLKVLSLEINPEGKNNEDLDEILKNLFNEATEKAKRAMAMKMQSTGNFPGL